MKRILVYVMILATLILTACGSTSANNQSEVSSAQDEVINSDTQETTEQQDTTTGETRTLVAYFSYADNAELEAGIDASSSASIQTWGDEITGNTGVVAHMLSEATGADLFSIQTITKYPSTYNGAVDQGQQERDDNARPELANHIENLDNYDTVFIGFPTWWYDMPMAMYSFFEEYDFSGKTIYMFCTSGGSGFLDTIESVQGLEPEAEVIEGLSIGASSAVNAEDQIQSWVQELGY